MINRSASLPAALARPPCWGRLLSPRYWPTWAGLGVLRLLSLLPFRLKLAVGAALGGLLRRLPLRFVRIARRNLELCLPELGAAARRRLLNRHFASLGIALLEIAAAWWCPTARLMAMSRVEGVEHLREALARGRGAILLTAHFTPLEIGGRILAAVIPVNVIYRPTKNEALAYVLGRCRSRNGGHAIPRDDIRAMVSALKSNEAVWYAPDQSYRKKGAQMVSLFGIPAATNTATSRIARMTGAAVLPYFVERLPGAAGYRAVIQPPLAGFPSECPRTDAERFHRLIEAQVRAVPDQYLWIHRRFKGLTAADPDYYGRNPPRLVSEPQPSAASPAA
ncbi:MAG: LpxL/LpxP family Kdo(2)-lipid IV(A) lauroyl/palmitoleoyl acyltransferase [Gammaproteobacteria bacterium]|nr:LpxL/LpxP family Kdo(2)-lipid IV(A) lauroyl/palmitoleoyl acyltransferase [Gammaproteobacteria bacterium]